MTFPKNFLWGVSNSGFQFEMGDPAGKNIDPNTDWYVWTHDASNIRKGIVSGDLPEKSVDYWSLYMQDIWLLMQFLAAISEYNKTITNETEKL